MGVLNTNIEDFLNDNTKYLLQEGNDIFLKSQLDEDILGFYVQNTYTKEIKLVFLYSVKAQTPILIFDREEDSIIFNSEEVFEKATFSFLPREKKKSFEQRTFKYILDLFKTYVDIEYRNFFDSINCLTSNVEDLEEDKDFQIKLSEGFLLYKDINSLLNNLYNFSKFTIFDYIKLATNIEEFAYEYVESMINQESIKENYINCYKLNKFIDKTNKEKDIINIRIPKTMIRYNYFFVKTYIIPLFKNKVQEDLIISPDHKQYINGIYYDCISPFYGEITIKINIHKLPSDIDSVRIIFFTPFMFTKVYLSQNSPEQVIEFSQFFNCKKFEDGYLVESFRLEKIDGEWKFKYNFKEFEDRFLDYIY